PRGILDWPGGEPDDRPHLVAVIGLVPDTPGRQESPLLAEYFDAGRVQDGVGTPAARAAWWFECSPAGLYGAGADLLGEPGVGGVAWVSHGRPPLSSLLASSG